MSRGSINKAIIIGRLGSDPEVRYSATGTPVANISVATNFARKNPNTDEWEDQTEWHRVAMFGRLAEVAGEYLRKGSQVYVEGRLQTRKWQDQSGQDRYTTEIIANEMQMLGGRGDMDANYNSAPSPAASTPAPAPAQAQAAPAAPAPAANKPAAADFDDDIPF